MDIAALSMISSQMQLQSQVSTQVLSMSMDMAEVNSDGLRKMMESSVTPEVGANIDISI